MGLRSKDILSILEDKTRDYQEKIALGTKDTFGWKEFTYKGIGQLSRKVARYIIDETEERYQFIRNGYYCLDSDTTPDKLVFNRTVTLKDSKHK